MGTRLLNRQQQDGNYWWKGRDRNLNWVPLKDLKDTNPVKLAECAVANKISEEQAFAWWVNFWLNKWNRIINKVKLKVNCWQTTHKYGIRSPKTAGEAFWLDRLNGMTTENTQSRKKWAM
jgi:hypothetical protein